MMCDSSLFITEAASFLQPKEMVMAMAMARTVDLSGQNLR
jgi:hypothetical protein